MWGANLTGFYRKRFRQPLARLGWWVIVLFSLLALAAPWLAPDPDPRANTMDMSIARRGPGFKTIQLAKLNPSGSPSPFAVDSFSVAGDSVFYVAPGQESAHPEVSSISLNQVVKLDNGSPLSAPKTFWLGTDRFGRDMLSRILRGARVSLSVGFMAVFIALVIGLALGLLAGYYRGRIDSFIRYVIDVVWSLPTLLVVIALTLALGKGFWQIFIAVGLTMWVDVARMVRGQVLSLREKEFIEASRALGQKPWRIMVFHLLPHVWGPLLVMCAANFASAILLEAGLSFLGLGVQPPEPSWGMMIKEHYSYIVTGGAYLALIPGFAIMLVVLAFNWLANGLRDALDVSR